METLIILRNIFSNLNYPPEKQSLQFIFLKNQEKHLLYKDLTLFIEKFDTLNTIDINSLLQNYKINVDKNSNNILNIDNMGVFRIINLQNLDNSVD